MVSESNNVRNHGVLASIVAAAAFVTLAAAVEESMAGGGGGRSGVSAECSKDTCNVEMTGLTFTPDTLKVRPGSTVVWTNTDKVAHTVTGGLASSAESAKQLFGASSLLTAGESWQRNFDVAGTFDYFCAVHPRMTAQVVVAGEPVHEGSELAPMIIAAAGISGALGFVATLHQKRKRR